MNSRIEQIIAEIEEYIESCKTQPLSKSNIVVNKEELDELLSELRERTPEEIKRYKKMLSNKDEILADARAKADEMIAQTKIQANEMVSEHKIMQQAYVQANEVVDIATNQAQEILDKATDDADKIRTAAIEYTGNLLMDLESIVVHTLDTSRNKYESLIDSLQECYDLVVENRKELTPPEEEGEETAAGDGKGGSGGKEGVDIIQ